MSRPKSYNRDAALMRACAAFWQHGYRALGVRAIEAQTGLNQFAIRTEFGGKEGLFLETLQLYSDQAAQTVLAPLQGGGVTEIHRFFENLVTPGSVNCSEWGCLIVNTGVENASIANPKIAAIIQNYWHMLTAGFSGSLLRAQVHGDVAADLDQRDTASALVGVVMGIHLMNRAAASPVAGRPLVEMVQSWIGHPGGG